MRRPDLALLLALLLAAASCGAPPSGAPAAVAPDQIAFLRARLATSGAFYYEFRVGEQLVAMCHSGVDVARYPTGPIRVGLPRAAWVTRGSADAWVGQVWEGAALDPPLVVERIQIIPGDASTRPTPETPGVIPPNLEDLTPVPPSYLIVFPDARCIQVDLAGEISGKVKERSAASLWWGDFKQGLGLEPAHPLRLRTQMDAKVGAALYRSFPDKPAFLILP